jgi:hypothetical protein
MQAAKTVGKPGSFPNGALRLYVVALFMCFGVAGCRVAAEDIEYWKGTVKGPGKIVAVMLAEKYPMELRTQAALALIDMERTDRDGTADLQQALGRLEEEERNALIAGMVPGLEQLMKKSEKPDGSASSRQIRAKDAAFLLITHAPPEVKSKLTLDVVDWYMQDFNGRSLAGNYSAEQVIRALGSPAAKVLVKGLKARMPQQALVKMAQLIGQLADPASRKEAGERIVAIEREMESREFLAWVRQSVSSQAERSGIKLEGQKLERIVEANRDSFINEGALPAMKWLGDDPAVKARLLELASTKANTDAGNMRRVSALAALEGKVNSNDLAGVLELALDARSPVEVRDAAFDRVGDIKSPQALPALWPLVASGDNQRLRWRAGELVLAIGGPQVVGDFFAKLPANAEYSQEELEGYATRMGQMTPLPTQSVRDQLGASAWYNRVIAIRFFERKGAGSDVERLKALTQDKAATKGPRWGKTKTVGDVAQEALTVAKQRLAQPSAP